MTPLDRMRLLRGAAHLHRLGADSIADVLADVAGRIGGGPAILAALAEWEQRRPAPPSSPGAGRAPSRPRRIAAGGRA